MEKTKYVLTVEINGNIYEFNCLVGSPRSGAIAATCQFNAFLLGKQEQSNAAQAKAEELTEIQVPKEFTE